MIRYVLYSQIINTTDILRYDRVLMSISQFSWYKNSIVLWWMLQHPAVTDMWSVHWLQHILWDYQWAIWWLAKWLLMGQEYHRIAGLSRVPRMCSYSTLVSFTLSWPMYFYYVRWRSLYAWGVCYNLRWCHKKTTL